MPTSRLETATRKRSAIDALNALRRSSISAGEICRMAIEKIESHADHHAIALRIIEKNHLDHAERLKIEILNRQGVPDETSGAWGVLAKTIEGAAALFGDLSAVRALKEGERHSISAALVSLPELQAPIAPYVQDTMLPTLVQHLELLDAILVSPA